MKGLIIGTTLISLNIAAIYAFFHIRKRRSNTELDGVLSIIGNTPLIKLEKLSAELGVNVLAKAEFTNPGGSVKDRVALKIMQIALETGKLKKGGVVFEGTSGSTGISLAMVCNALGHECVIYLPDDVAKEKINILKSVGATVRLCKSVSVVDDSHMCKAAQKGALEIDPNQEGRGFFADQFETPANFLAHVQGTGVEIANQCLSKYGPVHAFVSGAGTGGTISGCGVALKRRFGKDVKVLLADPPGSALLLAVERGVVFNEKDKEGFRRRVLDDTIVEGVGLNRLTSNFRAGLGVIDGGFAVSDAECVRMSRYLVKTEGVFVGSSSGMNLVAIVKAVKEGKIEKGSNVVTILCDSGMRHLSKLYSQEYLEKRSEQLGVAGKEVLHSVFDVLDK